MKKLTVSVYGETKKDLVESLAAIADLISKGEDSGHKTVTNPGRASTDIFFDIITHEEE